MKNKDTICTEEQPCKQKGCSYCDPFDMKPEEAQPDHGYAPDVVTASPIPFGLGDSVAKQDLEDDAYAKVQKRERPVSPIPSLDDAYRTMRSAYLAYEDAVGTLSLEEDKAAQDRIGLEKQKNDILLQHDPKALGANEEQRRASINTLVGTDQAMYQARLRSVELLKCEAEIARIRCRFADNTLRFCEALIMSEQGEYSE